MATVVKVRRKSNYDPEVMANQDFEMDRYIAAKGWHLLTTINLPAVERDKVKAHLKQYVLMPLQQLKPNILLYRDAERIGIIKPEDIGWLLAELHELGIDLYQVDVGEITMNNLASAIQTISAPLAVRDTQLKMSRKALDGRRRNVLRKTSTGSTPPFGYDHLVLNRNGEPKYKVVYEGYKAEEGHHKSKLGGKWKINHALRRLKVYPNGNTERYDDQWVPCEDEGLGPWQRIANKPLLEEGDRKIITYWRAVSP